MRVCVCEGENENMCVFVLEQSKRVCGVFAHINRKRKITLSTTPKIPYLL